MADEYTEIVIINDGQNEITLLQYIELVIIFNFQTKNLIQFLDNMKLILLFIIYSGMGWSEQVCIYGLENK